MSEKFEMFLKDSSKYMQYSFRWLKKQYYLGLFPMSSGLIGIYINSLALKWIKILMLFISI